MISDCVKSSLIPTDTVALWRAATLDCLAQLLGTANITLGHVEELLETQSRKLMLPILAAAAAQQLFVCPVCGKPLQREAKMRPRTLDSVFGALGFKRDYGWCPKCEQYFHPADHATVFRLDQRTQTQSGRPLITQRKYVATRQGLDEFTRQLYAETLSCGLPNAKEVLVIADGAIWIWNLAQSRFKEAKQRVDLYHVKEHLHELARALHPEDAQARERWLAPLLRYLESRNDGALDVLRELKDLSLKLKNLTGAQQAAIDREIGYFTTHHKRMDYKRGKAAGEPVGSGAVESTARQYQTRFKCVGQYWTLVGDEALLALATLDRNDRWHRLYPHIPAQSSKSQN